MLCVICSGGENDEPGKEIIEFSRKKIKEFNVSNKIITHQAFAENLPQENEVFDLVFCSGVFMFTKQNKALIEFSRVLKKDGIVLITANGLGYFIMYLLNGIKYRSIKKTQYGLVGIANTLIKWIVGKQFGVSAVSHTEMKDKLLKNGFELYDTRIWLAQELYPLEHLGFVTNYAFIAKKVSGVV